MSLKCKSDRYPVLGQCNHYRWYDFIFHLSVLVAPYGQSGAIVITVAKSIPYLLGGRFVLGFGVAITTTAAPAYVVEMSPPQVGIPRFIFRGYF